MLVFLSVMCILLFIGALDAFGSGRLTALVGIVIIIVLAPVMILMERLTHYLGRFISWMARKT